MLTDILKAFIIGICVSIPIGPIATVVMQKSLRHGRKVGLITSFGGTCVDTIFAMLSLVALSAAQEYIAENQKILLFVAGGIILLVGIFMLYGAPESVPEKEEVGPVKKKDETSLGLKYAAQTFFSGISNPGALLVHFTLFSAFQVQPEGAAHRAIVIAAVCLGSIIYWLGFTAAFAKFGRMIRPGALGRLCRLTAFGVIAFGIFFIGKGIYLLII